MVDVFFGVDYHSHLGTSRGGLAAYDENIRASEGNSQYREFTFQNKI